MEHLHPGFKPVLNTEPDDKYGVQFEFNDLCQRLQVIKRQRERQFNGRSFKSFEKIPKKSPPSRPTIRNKSGTSLRSNSFTKNQNRCISSDFKQILKIYSPNSKQKISTPEKFLSSIRFPTIIQKQKLGKRLVRVNKAKS